jgi:hypothetical protein
MTATAIWAAVPRRSPSLAARLVAVRNPHYLRVFVNRIRHKLEPDPPHPR